MNHHIYKFSEINPNHPDLSDYETFYIYCKEFLTDHPNHHNKISKLLIECLSKFTNHTLLSITYRLLAYIQPPPLIPPKTIHKHFKISQLKSPILTLLSKNKQEILQQEIHQMLFDPTYESPGLFDILSSDQIENFLNIEDTNLLRKQLNLRIYKSCFSNLEKLLPHFGNKENDIAFKISELFMLRNTFDIGKNWVIGNKETLMFNNTINVDNTNNFFFHFFEFFKEREVLKGLIRDGNTIEIQKILTRYIKPDDAMRFTMEPRYKRLLITKKKPRPSVNNKYHETDFEYLFTRKSYKVISDCIEI
ncbi:hypothetical protein TCON_0342 [Astathelohania contejeani]|uniref:Maturase K n=1 Tax=Astathelohania contejeani TaxID=164912 RepID=A0ABQ7I216_9MICR|nr:hypothetical protein TCON_0342 [Thelohania contejeani]